MAPFMSATTVARMEVTMLTTTSSLVNFIAMGGAMHLEISIFMPMRLKTMTTRRLVATVSSRTLEVACAGSNEMPL
jgi:hypothetical protein